MTFKAHQQYGLDWLSSRRRAILAFEQRLGKTPLLLEDVTPPALVICPAYLKFNWLEECRRWRPDLVPQILSPDSRPEPGSNLWIVNFEILQECWLPAAPHLIVDEGHYCKSHESKRSITVIALAERAERVRWSTGTVMPNRSMELWPVLRAMNALPREYSDAESFGMRFADGYEDRYGTHFRGNSNSEELRRIMHPFILRVTRAQIGMPENDWRVLALDLPVDERERAYSLDAIQRNPNPVAFEGLADLLHFQGLSKIPQALRFLRDIIEEGEGPVLVFAWHEDVVRTLAIELGRAHRVREITGATPHTRRREFVDAFQRGEVDYLIGNIQAMGTGLAAHAAERVVFVEGRWTPGDMMQAGDRAVSMDKPRSVRVDVLTVHQSIDEFMVRRCLEKQRAIDSIIQPSKEFQLWQERQRHPVRLPRPS